MQPASNVDHHREPPPPVHELRAPPVEQRILQAPVVHKLVDQHNLRPDNRSPMSSSQPPRPPRPACPPPPQPRNSPHSQKPNGTTTKPPSREEPSGEHFAARVSSFWNSRSPWKNSESMSFTAICWPEAMFHGIPGQNRLAQSCGLGKRAIARRSWEKEKRWLGLGSASDH
ncbi:hypothetical protein HPP92_001341 [Vanilla planifolia]|uniref:Uncharacterized protein n=1 Tax=Vanilla planifolia TaxID=51239 RepID=A0A835S4F1_VANPL|nr:hypothetical protein HPP92_001341 [Vanilla planifolia]